MKQLIISGLVAITLSLPVSYADESTSPKFKDYRVSSVYRGPTATLKQDNEDSRMFRTRLQDALSGPVSIAGEYVMALWGCGTSCLHGGLVSKKTGKAVLFPWSICCWSGEGDNLFTRPNSRLFVVGGKLGEGEDVQTGGIHGAHFYEFTGTEFKYIKSIAVPEVTYTD